MVLDAVPVIPPDLRPMVQLDGGRFATSDLNDLYRRVINRNNRLKRLLDLGAPEIIVNNEKRMLQEAVDSLFDNGRRGRPVTGPGNRPLKSLSDMLKGKQGRFRQNLLGKRVDYSGRSVIVSGPQLKLHQCGLPKMMALELFKPFVMKRLVDLSHAQNIKSAKRMVERATSGLSRYAMVWDVLEEVIMEHPVLLNRAPTLHRLGIQAFEPQLIEGKAIQIHPLVCGAFNADFDGDQMAVHLPLSAEAQAEARILMLSTNNILKPSDGRPVTMPSQDMIIGLFWLTTDREGEPGEGRVVLVAGRGDHGLRPGRDLAAVEVQDPPRRRRAAARVGPRRLGGGSRDHARDHPGPLAVQRHPARRLPLRELRGRQAGAGRDRQRPGRALHQGRGRGVAGRAQGRRLPLGHPLGRHGLDRRRHHPGRQGPRSSREFEKQAAKVQKQFERGLVTDDERRQELIEIWTEAASARSAKSMEANFDKTNSIYMMVDSGASGNMNQIRQVAAMRGLVANPKGEIIPRPIKSNFREGLTVLEYFIATHGARKGLADTALRTADSGYLTRRLVDVSQDVIIREDDCGTERGLDKIIGVRDADGTVRKDDNAETAAYARTSAVEITPPRHRRGAGRRRARTSATSRSASSWRPGSRTVKVRSVLTCDAKTGTCAKCYGRSLATGKLVDIGEAVGIIAAQSIGEPGTQLTMRTFHTGGVASADDITQGLPRVVELFEARSPKGVSPITEVAGRVEIEETDKARVVKVTPDDGSEVQEYPVSRRSRLRVGDGDHLEVGDQLVVGTPDPKEVLRILGVRKTQQHLVDEVQAVYRSQGVAIHDKHIEIIVRQMLRRITVLESGDTHLLPSDLVDRVPLRGGEPSRGLRGRQAGLGSPGAHGHHQGLARDRVVALGGLLPGDHPGAHRRGHPRPLRLAARSEGERHHRQADPGGHRPRAVPQHPGGAHRGGPRRGVLRHRLRLLRLRVRPVRRQAVALDDFDFGSYQN